MKKNFNSHAHVERDEAGIKPMPYVTISTHTLTWSVTLLTLALFTRLTISTHTLTWSVTSACRKADISHFLFQLTRSRGA